MYTKTFNYHRPTTLEEAQSLFRQSLDARYLAGGQTLIPTMKQRLAAPADLIDLGRLREFSYIREANGALVIGAGTRHADVAGSALVQKAIPALAVLAQGIGDPAVRHRGTIGGSIANNDPAADYPAAVVGLNATVTTTSRKLSADSFFTGMFATALEDDEIITEIAFPIAKKAGYAKFPNPASRYAMVGVFVAEMAGSVRVAVTGAGPCVFRVAEMENALAKSFSPEAIANIIVPTDDLNSDLHGSREYRSHLTTVMAKRAVRDAS
jgi:carbon-monoxide dehydrogenase medium subunit